MYDVTDIEDGILATLKSDSELAAYVKLFTPIPSLQEDLLEQLIVQFPAIGVISPRGSYDYLTVKPNPIQVETALIDILLFNKNLRSLVAPIRGGAPGEKGLADMERDCCRILLAGLCQDDGQGGLAPMKIASCLPKRRTLLFSGEPFAAASLEVEVKWANHTNRRR